MKLRQPRRARALARLGLFAALFASSVSAQPAFHESEPNDTPEQANRISGATRIVGTLPVGDQDGFLWTVSDVDATTPWTFVFQGVPGTLSLAEVIRLEYAADGTTLTGRKTLFTLGSRDGSRPSAAENLLFEPGDYLLGVARAGSAAGYRPPADSIRFGSSEKDDRIEKSGAPAVADDEGYRLAIEPGKPYTHGSAAADNSRKDRAIVLTPGRQVSAYASGEQNWYRFTLDGKGAANRWDLTAQVPVGRHAALELADANGAMLAQTKSNNRGAMKLPDLSLAAGSYLVQLKGAAESLQALALEQAGVRVDGEEAEPNDQWALANRASFDSPMRGRFQRGGDDDHFAFEVGAEAAERRLALEVVAAPGSRYELCLLDHRVSRLQCRTGAGKQRLDSLVLEPGVYGVKLGRGVEGMSYTLQLVEEGPHAPGLEAEPNDSVALATSVPSKLRIKGSLAEGDQDFIRFDLAGEAQLWRFQVNGSGVHEVAYHDGAGVRAQVVRAQPRQGRIVLDNLFLLPGTHYIAVSGRGDGAYTLLARPLGPPDPNAELEPNDDVTRMQPIRVGQARIGLLSDPADRDNYRFHLTDHDHIRLSITPPPDGQIRALLYWDGSSVRESRSNRLGEKVVLEGLFPPGDYRLEMNAEKASDAEYRLEFSRLDRFSCVGDCEPNDDPAFARPIPPDRILRGRVGEWRDDDWYALPVFDVDTALTIRSEKRQQVALLAHARDRDALVRDKSGDFSGVIPAGAQRYLQVRGDGEYRMTLRLGDEAPPQPALALPIALGIELAPREVAAYRPFGQRLEGQVTLRNTGTEAVSVTVDATTSDARWRAEIEPKTLRIAAAASVSAALRLAVPDDAWADRPVRVSVRARGARGAGGAATEIGIDVVARRDIDAVHPVAHWEAPDALRGGFNLAWRALGGRWLGKEDSRIGMGLGDIFDGMAVRDEGLLLRGDNTPNEYESSVELAGAGPTEIAGVVLNPLGKRSAREYLRRFRIALSEDGKQFDTVLDGALEPLPHEQYFVFDQPRRARFARLTLVDDQNGNPGAGRGLGEWKVVARPGFDPFAGKRLNLADPQLGGHVVRASPTISAKWDDALLDPDSAPTRVRLRAGEQLDWVIGFHHDRAAQIDGIEWVDVADPGKQALIDEIRVFASRDSPLGPWEPVATWKLAGDRTRRLALERPIWARFVRFVTGSTDKDITILAPSVVRIFERPVAADYLSIVGEWGFNGHRAVYEAQHPPKPQPPYALSRHGSREQAGALELGKTVESRVWLGRHEHWYRVQVPAGRNTLEIELAGDPTVRTVATIETASGEPVATRLLERGPAVHRLEARLEPQAAAPADAGQTLFIKVEEPPRNVVFAWDTSASVGAYLPVIYNAISSYARGLVPGRDAANLMPFGSGLLLECWHGEPYLLQKILNEYPRKESSSESEGTLERASKALAERAGAKAILLITDAATNRHSSVWRAFDEVRPRVIALGLDSQGAFGRNPPREQDLLQDWSRVNNGHYSHLRTEGEMEIAFDRAATLLREPAPYRLTVDAQFKEPLAPGSLLVVSGGSPGTKKGSAPASGNAVALILDASGSMLQRMQGERRIEIARRGLIEAVSSHIAPGTPVSLRVFGHRQPNACRTDLEIPLAPLDPSTAKRVIERIEARNLARTPIADSLASVESDLAKARGTRTIVLVSDGEETCGGDPETVISKLQEKGIDFRLNIIGFALADDALEARFAGWAELGGGQYFRATDADGFERALRAALKPPFRVLDRDGAEVATGLVDGEAVAVPAGDYRVVVMAAETRRFDGVRVPAGGEVRVRLD